MEISTPVAVLLGACVGAASSISGALLSHYLEFRRNREKWQLEKKVEAYSNSLRYLTRVKNWQTAIDSKRGKISEEHISECLNDLCEVRIWLSHLQIYCSKEYQAPLTERLNSLNGIADKFMDGLGSGEVEASMYGLNAGSLVLQFFDEIRWIYDYVYNRARDELNS